MPDIYEDMMVQWLADGSMEIQSKDSNIVLDGGQVAAVTDHILNSLGMRKDRASNLVVSTRDGLMESVDRFKESRRPPLVAGEVWKVTTPEGREIVALALISTGVSVQLYRVGDYDEVELDPNLPRIRISTAEGEYVG